MIGRIVSVKLKNTATVLVSRVAMDPLYKKTFTRSKKYLVEDLIGVKEGDVVEVINCKPISGSKNMRIVKVLGKSLAEITEEKLKASAEEAISEVMPEKEVVSSENQELGNQVEKKDQEEGGSKEVKNQKSKVKNTGKN